MVIFKIRNLSGQRLVGICYAMCITQIGLCFMSLKCHVKARLFHVFILYIQLNTQVWTHMNIVSAKTHLQHIHRISVVFIWRHYRGAGELNTYCMSHAKKTCSVILFTTCFMLGLGYLPNTEILLSKLSMSNLINFYISQKIHQNWYSLKLFIHSIDSVLKFKTWFKIWKLIMYIFLLEHK